jgi:hypothetical protein
MRVLFNPNDPWQLQFLSCLSLGETAHRPDAQWLGVGNHDLRKQRCAPNGFPIWNGVERNGSTSHAVGVFQFEPATWDDIAKRYSLHFGNVADQYAGAWYLAQEVIARTGHDLLTELKHGSFRDIEYALAKTWPSVLGNGANPMGLAALLKEKLS